MKILKEQIGLFVCFFFLTSVESNTAISRTGSKTDVWQFTWCHTWDSVETMTSVSAGHIILKPIQLVKELFRWYGEEEN